MYDLLHHWVLSVLAQVPAGGGLEFHLRVFAGGEERRDFRIAGLRCEYAESFESGVLHRLGDEREGGEDIGKFILGEAVEMRDEAVEFRALS